MKIADKTASPRVQIFTPPHFSPMAFWLSCFVAHCQATQTNTQTKACQRPTISNPQTFQKYCVEITTLLKISCLYSQTQNVTCKNKNEYSVQ